jgi:hypothetical protein
VTDYGDALIPPYDKIVIASQVLRDLGGDATYQQVWDLLLEYGLDPFEPSWDDVMDAVISLRPPERSRSAPS